MFRGINNFCEIDVYCYLKKFEKISVSHWIIFLLANIDFSHFLNTVKNIVSSTVYKHSFFTIFTPLFFK